MRVISGIADIQNAGLQDTAVTIGTFDGVHLGQHKIVSSLITVAEENELQPLLITFEPHPQMVLKTRGPIEILTVLEEKLNLLAAAGVETVIVLEFDKKLATLTPDDFVNEILIKKLNMKALVIGYDHAFGRNRSGNKTLLEEMSLSNGFGFSVVSQLTVDGQAVKSSFIRRELKTGD